MSHVEQLLNCFKFKNYNKNIQTTIKERHTTYTKSVNKLYDKTDKTIPLARCEKFWRCKNLDLFEKEMNTATESISRGCNTISTATGTTRLKMGKDFKMGKVQPNEYVKSIFADEKYCSKIINFSRDYEILEPGNDFSLNTKITRSPEKIEQYIGVLRNYCELHHLIEK